MQTTVVNYMKKIILLSLQNNKKLLKIWLIELKQTICKNCHSEATFLLIINPYADILYTATAKYIPTTQ